MNRMLHVELKPAVRDWLEWAYSMGIHEWVVKYVETRPDHLFIPPPKIEKTFTTPRSWHILSDALISYGNDISQDEIELLASGCLSPGHSRSFGAFIKQIQNNINVDAILQGKQLFPRKPEDRDVLYFIVQAIRAQLAKTLPPNSDSIKPAHRIMVKQAKQILLDLCDTSVEMATIMVAEEEGVGAVKSKAHAKSR